jgi:hypothetical protein
MEIKERITREVNVMKEEYMAAGIRQQIESLVRLYSEMEQEQIDKTALTWRLQSVEVQLRRLREAA